MKGFRLILAAGIGVALLSGISACGGADESTAVETVKPPSHLQPLGVTLNGKYGPENVGILMALQRGYFEDAGFKVELQIPLLPTRSVRYVSERVIDISISHEPEVVLARERGAPVAAFGSLISHPTAAMIWLKKSGIKRIADLKGKTIAVPGLYFQKAFLKSILERAGLTLSDVKVKGVGYELVPALLNGKADAIFGGSANVEGAELEAEGLQPVITPVQELGLPSYDELVLIARSHRLATNPQMVRPFMSALARGTAAANEDPGAAAKAIAEANSEGVPNPEPVTKALRAGLAATLPLLSRSGRMSLSQTDQLVKWMHNQGLIRRRLPALDVVSKDYLETRPASRAAAP